ncbi:hypothetical protein B0H13DRAFT_1856786 [Mycena leptocephala]|nr:hypothetical protein B0H13DRAFT_1856786 [Mycena leptocephala]
MNARGLASLPFVATFGGGGRKSQPPSRVPRAAFSREELLMQLLTAEHYEEKPDDGELSGSGDTYDVGFGVAVRAVQAVQLQAVASSTCSVLKIVRVTRSE